MERVSSAVAVEVAAAVAIVGVAVEIGIETASETAVAVEVKTARDTYPKAYLKRGPAYSLLQRNPPIRAIRNTGDAIRSADAEPPSETETAMATTA